MQFRYYKKWRRSLEGGASSINDRMPWLTYDAIGVLESNLTKASTVFEFGAGGSTLYFLDRVAKVYSVEHNPEWIGLLKKVVSAEEVGRWYPFLCEPSSIQGESSFTRANPEGYLSDDESYSSKSFREYASVIDRAGVSAFDVVLVDGRARPSCIMHSLDKVKSGGLLVVDNVERRYYLQDTASLISERYEPVLQGAGATAYISNFTKTAIWRRL